MAGAKWAPHSGQCLAACRKLPAGRCSFIERAVCGVLKAMGDSPGAAQGLKYQSPVERATAASRPSPE